MAIENVFFCLIFTLTHLVFGFLIFVYIYIYIYICIYPYWIHRNICRSSHHVLWKGVLQNYKNLTEKHLCWSLFWTSNFIKKRLQHRCFPVKFAKLLRTRILKNICKRLLHFLRDVVEWNGWNIHDGVFFLLDFRESGKFPFQNYPALSKI